MAKGTALAKAGKGTAVTTQKAGKKSGALISWEDQLKSAAAMYKSAEANAGGGKFISVRAGIMAFDGAPIKENTIEGIVLESMHENAYYTDAYDADNPHAPVCFAFSEPMTSLKPGEEASELENRMAPHKDSAEPQHATCKGCPQNEFGTAETGKGKACRNIRRIAILHSDYLKKPATIPSAPIAFMKVPPTSCGGWAAYVKKVANVLEKPPFAVITKISCRPDVKKQVVVEFDVSGEIKGSEVGSAVFKRHQEAYSLLAIPYQPEAEGAAKKPAKGAAKKKARKY